MPASSALFTQWLTHRRQAAQAVDFSESDQSFLATIFDAAIRSGSQAGHTALCSGLFRATQVAASSLFAPDQPAGARAWLMQTFSPLPSRLAILPDPDAVRAAFVFWCRGLPSTSESHRALIQEFIASAEGGALWRECHPFADAFDGGYSWGYGAGFQEAERQIRQLLAQVAAHDPPLAGDAVIPYVRATLLGWYKHPDHAEKPEGRAER